MERVKIHGGRNAWDYPQGVWLQALLECGLHPDFAADLWIHVDENIPAAKKGQIDLIVRGYFPSALAVAVPVEAGIGVHRLLIRSIIATIEVKRHFRDNVELTPSSAIVFDNQGKGNERSPSSVTEDGQLQLFALKEYLLSRTIWDKEPWLARAIYFPSLTEADLPKEPHFYLAADTTFEQVVRRLCISAMKKSYPNGETFVLNSFRSIEEDGLQRVQDELGMLLGKRVSTQRAAESAGQDSSEPFRTLKPQIELVQTVQPPESNLLLNVFRFVERLARNPVRAGTSLRWFWRRRRFLFVSGVVLGVILFVVLAIEAMLRKGKVWTETPDVTEAKICLSGKPGLRCGPDLTFHPGDRVVLRLALSEKQAVSASVTKPGSTAQKAEASIQSDASGCWVQYKLPKHAQPGTYSFDVLLMPKLVGLPKLYQKTFLVVP